MMKKTIALIVTACMILSAAFASGAGENKGKLSYMVASDCTWPPMEYIDENGDIVGFDIDLIALISEKTGVEFSVKNVTWDTIFAGLANGQYDVVCSSVTITEDRMKALDFTAPYTTNGQVVVAPAESTFESVSDLAGLPVGVQIGTSGDFALDSYGTDTKRYDDIGLAIEDMLNGNLDACVCDALIAADYVMKNEKYAGLMKIVGEPFTDEQFGIAVKKGNSEALDILDEGLRIAEEDGSLAELKAKWGVV